MVINSIHHQLFREGSSTFYSSRVWSRYLGNYLVPKFGTQEKLMFSIVSEKDISSVFYIYVILLVVFIGFLIKMMQVPGTYSIFSLYFFISLIFIFFFKIRLFNPVITESSRQNISSLQRCQPHYCVEYTPLSSNHRC